MCAALACVHAYVRMRDVSILRRQGAWTARLRYVAAHVEAWRELIPRVTGAVSVFEMAMIRGAELVTHEHAPLGQLVNEGADEDYSKARSCLESQSICPRRCQCLIPC